ncbi:hypothetical protein ACSBR1_002480 [Camellia fascicularis]
MGVSVQYPDPVKEDLFGLNDWGQIWSNCKEVGGSVDDLVAELGSALEDALILLSTSAPPLEGCEVCFVGNNKDCGELIINQDESLMLTSNTKLGENLSLPCSGNVLFHDVRVNGNDKISNAALDEHCSLESGNPVSIPTSLNVVSAMKGSREKQGLQVEKMSVSWAADVYDPPPISQSHTVTRQMNKKSHRCKHKQHKAKSSRSSNIDKKQHHRKRNSSSKVASY